MNRPRQIGAVDDEMLFNKKIIERVFIESRMHCPHPTSLTAADVNASKNNVAGLSQSTRRALNVRGVHIFTIREYQIEHFTRCFVKAIVTGNIPFTFVDNPHLIEACQSLGLPTISRKQLADKWVPLLAEEASISNAATLARMALVDASSDGCRNKYREKGAALNNIIALVPDRAYFHDAINCTSMRKDAEAIATFLADAAKGLVDEDLDRLVGWVLDNTKANCRAMLTLQERFPKWIMRGCFAHCLALLMNDFCNYKATTGRNAGARTYGMRWAETCVRDANTVANYLQDSGPARNLVRSVACAYCRAPICTVLLSAVQPVQSLDICSPCAFQLHVLARS
jgi:hypothetical protein